MSDLIIDISRPLIRALEGRLHTGVDRVCLAYMRYYKNTARAAVYFLNRLWIFPASVSRRLFDLMLVPGQNVPGRLLAITLRWGATTWFPENLKNAILLNLGHSNLQKESYLLSIRHYKLRLVSFVHDLIPITHPEYCRQEQQFIHTERVKNALAHSSGIVTNSRDTLEALESHSIGHVLPLPPVISALIAADPPTAPKAARPVHEPYFILIGTIEPRKNYTFLLQVWREIALQQGLEKTPRLILIGQRGWECENTVDLLDRCPSLQGIVQEVNSCSDHEMATFLHHAQALLFPSFAEGFGLPVAEALSAGVPVIASDLPVFKEFAGAIPEYLSPLDGPGWKRAILDYAQHSSLRRAAQKDRLRGFKPPSWETHFESVDGLLTRLRQGSPLGTDSGARLPAMEPIEDAEPVS